jgi:hypothetical protein
MITSFCLYVYLCDNESSISTCTTIPQLDLSIRITAMINVQSLILMYTRNRPGIDPEFDPESTRNRPGIDPEFDPEFDPEPGIFNTRNSGSKNANSGSGRNRNSGVGRNSGSRNPSLVDGCSPASPARTHYPPFPCHDYEGW